MTDFRKSSAKIGAQMTPSISGNSPPSASRSVDDSEGLNTICLEPLTQTNQSLREQEKLFPPPPLTSRLKNNYQGWELEEMADDYRIEFREIFQDLMMKARLAARGKGKLSLELFDYQIKNLELIPSLEDQFGNRDILCEIKPTDKFGYCDVYIEWSNSGYQALVSENVGSGRQQRIKNQGGFSPTQSNPNQLWTEYPIDRTFMTIKEILIIWLLMIIFMGVYYHKNIFQ